MILPLAAAHASIFNTLRQAFFDQIRALYFFVSLVSFYHKQFWQFSTFSILFHLLTQILTLDIHGFNPLRYTCEFNT